MNDLRVIKTFKMRAVVSLALGLVMAFMCGGYRAFGSISWSIAPILVGYWFCCAGMIFCVTYLIDNSISRHDQRRR